MRVGVWNDDNGVMRCSKRDHMASSQQSYRYNCRAHDTRLCQNSESQVMSAVCVSPRSCRYTSRVSFRVSFSLGHVAASDEQSWAKDNTTHSVILIIRLCGTELLNLRVWCSFISRQAILFSIFDHWFGFQDNLGHASFFFLSKIYTLWVCLCWQKKCYRTSQNIVKWWYKMVPDLADVCPPWWLCDELVTHLGCHPALG